MTIEDDAGTCHSIPLSSRIKFGLLYNPNGDITKAMRGFHFRTISEMTKCKTFPRVMRATKTFRSNKHGLESSVMAGEVLIIKEFQGTRKKHAHVEVFSLLSSKHIQCLYMVTLQSLFEHEYLQQSSVHTPL